VFRTRVQHIFEHHAHHVDHVEPEVGPEVGPWLGHPNQWSIKILVPVVEILYCKLGISNVFTIYRPLTALGTISCLKTSWSTDHRGPQKCEILFLTIIS